MLYGDENIEETAAHLKHGAKGENVGRTEVSRQVRGKASERTQVR